MNARPAYLVAVLVGLIVLAPVTSSQTLNGFELKGSLVPPDQILHGAAKID